MEVSRIINKSNRLFSSAERVNNEILWDELAEFTMNNQHKFFRQPASSFTDISTFASTNAGTKKTRRLFDSTAIQAVHDLAAAFQGLLTNPATVWSRLRFKDDALNNNEEAVMWLEDVNRIIHESFNTSNFNVEIGKAYQNFVSLANMIMLHEAKEDDNGNFDGYRFTSMHMGQISWEENKDGLVDSVYIKFQMTARQAIEKWGDAVSHEIREAVENDPDKHFDFLQAVFPRDKKDIKLNAVGLAPGKHRPFANVFIDMNSSRMLEEGGYYEFPFYIARWSLLPSERYGRGPGHIALPEIRSLNRLKRRALEAIDLQVRPHWFVNQRDVFGSLDMRPGAISVVRNHEGIREHVTQARNDVMQFSSQEMQENIKRMYFLDKLQPLATLEKKERMSQFEVVKRLEEMQAVLGPVLARLNNELLQPLIVRSFKILLRSGTLPELPGILAEQGVDVDIVFVNQLARAQQVQDITTIQQWINDLALLAQAKPEVLDNIDADGVAKHTAKILGVPEEAVANDDVVAQIRQQRAEAAQRQAALESANMAADTAVKLGNSQEE